MAWQARLTAPVIKPQAGMTIEVSVTYYDDTDLAQASLHVRTFQFEASTSGPEMRQAIVAEGQQARAIFNRATNINNNVATAGTTIAIP